MRRALIEALIWALEDVSDETRSCLHGDWGPLDDVYAFAVVDRRTILDDEDIRRVDESLVQLGRIVKELLDKEAAASSE